MALARRAAAAGRTVVLVDANTLRPALTESLSLPRTRWVPADRSARSALFHVPDLGLSILPAPDVADPLAFRESTTLRRTFESDLKEFDLIVIDTSPVTEAHCDAIPPEVVAAASAATVLVIMAGVTPEQSVMRAVERLKQSGATIAGAVFNDRFNPTVASEIQRRTRFLSKIAPAPDGTVVKPYRQERLAGRQCKMIENVAECNEIPPQYTPSAASISVLHLHTRKAGRCGRFLTGERDGIS